MGNAKIVPKDSLLLPYQRRWVEDGSRLKLAVKSRQIGWTWATAYGLIRRKALKDAQLDAWISSRDEIQARLFLEDCKNFAGILDAGAQDFGERVIDGSGSSAYVLQMGNGLRINSMSSNPDAQAGKRGDRVLDEFALHPDPRKLYAIAYPGITWGGKFEVFSTPRGSDSFFQRLIDEIKGGNPKRFSFHKITLEDALNQGFLAKLQRKLPAGDERQEMDEAAYFDFIKAGCADEETFNQEYMCVPANDATAFISYEMLDGNHVPGTVERETGTVDGKESIIERWHSSDPVGNGPLYLGVDYARHTDYTVAWLSEDVAGILIPRELTLMKNVPFKRQRAMLDGHMKRRNLIRCCFDMTGIGEETAETMHAHYGWRFEPVRFTAASKESMAYPVRHGLEDKTFKVPNLAKVDADFRKIRKETTASGNVRFTGERDAGGHADIFWAGALCREAKGHGASGYCQPPDEDFDERYTRGF